MTLSTLKLTVPCKCKGPTLSHCDNVPNPDVPEAEGKVQTCSSGISGSSCTFGCSEGSLQMTMVPCITIPDRICPLDGDITSERAFLINVGAFNGLLSFRAQTNILVISWEFLLAAFSKQDPFLILKAGRLLLVGTLCLKVHHVPGYLKKR